MDHDLTPAAACAYAVWFRHTYPVIETVPPWQLLEPATRALWEQIAQAVLRREAGRERPASPPPLATLLARVEDLSLFVGYDPGHHAPLEEVVTLEDRLRTIDATLELMQGQLAAVLALLRGEAAHA